MKYYIKEMRVHHYVKNILVLAPLICSGQFFDKTKLIPAILAVLAFCMMSSAIYYINDLRDLEKDKKHPVKSKRPIASGNIPVRGAVIFAIVLVIISLALNIPMFSFEACALLLVYLLLNVLYSMGLKNKPIIDLAILVSGFLIRVLYGAVVTDIEISNWLYLTVISAAFYFSLGKRRNELIKVSEGDTREVLKYYNKSFLDSNMYMCLALTNMFYALWTMDEKTQANYGEQHLIWTTPIVLLICMRYSLDVEGDSLGDPVEVLLDDKFLIILCLVYGLLMFGLIYF